MKKRMLLAILLILPFLATVPTTYNKNEKVEAAEIVRLLGKTTGYTKADDFDYVKSGKYIANWGARGEDCVFLSKNAEAFYKQSSSYSYDTISKKSGGTGKSDAPSSALYTALKTMMTSEHSYITSYDETRSLYRYTDCVNGNYSNISSFYSAKKLDGAWDSAETWNREHCWPRSKCINKNKAQDSADIMTLRPTWVEENSSRGNTAYGESGSYYNPNSEANGIVDLRGDCARIVLYGYTRWGNTSYMWGSSGVMESVDVLLKWMEADPVDTWEMGRNDSVESITGTRNVFVDYPEYAWLLFGEDVPDDMVTPSGGKSSTSTPSDSSASSSSSSSSQSSEKVESSDSNISSESSANSQSSTSTEKPETPSTSQGSWGVGGEWDELPTPEMSESSGTSELPEQSELPQESEKPEQSELLQGSEKPNESELPESASSSASSGSGDMIPPSAGCDGSVSVSLGIAGATLPICVLLKVFKKKKEE